MAVQGPNAVTAYLKSKQLLRSGFAERGSVIIPAALDAPVSSHAVILIPLPAGFHQIPLLAGFRADLQVTTEAGTIYYCQNTSAKCPALIAAQLWPGLPCHCFPWHCLACHCLACYSLAWHGLAIKVWLDRLIS